MLAQRNQLENEGQEPENPNSFWNRYGSYIVLGLLIVYVILLGIGTYAELTENEKILNWWIFR